MSMPDASLNSAPHGSASEDIFNSEEYEKFVNSMVSYCDCEPPHRRPCDGVLAGGLCDEMREEPDFTLDDLEWSEEYEM